MALNVKLANELASRKWYRVFLYGNNRSGKTFFSSTWPRPLYLVPATSDNELMSVSDMAMPYLTFGGLEECKKIVDEVCTLILKGKHIGPYVPMTIVIDNVTAALDLFEDELKGNPELHNVSFGQKILDKRSWGVLTSLFDHIRVVLHSLPCHVIWITHAQMKRTIKADGSDGESIGSWTLRGSSERSLPGHSDLLLYAKVIDRKPRRPGYFIHGEPDGIWPAGMRLPAGVDGFKVLGPQDGVEGIHPCYDDLAPYLGLPTLEEIEAGDEK